MSSLNTFLKVLKKFGYPNPEIGALAKMVDYDLREFIPDMISEIGEDKTNKFVRNAINKMATKDGIKIQDHHDPKQYAYIHILNPHVDLDGDTSTIVSDWAWGDTNILYTDEYGDESYRTIEEISNEVDMGDWADFDEMVDDIKDDCNDLVYNNCGFNIWWDDRKDL